MRFKTFIKEENLDYNNIWHIVKSEPHLRFLGKAADSVKDTYGRPLIGHGTHHVIEYAPRIPYDNGMYDHLDPRVHRNMEQANQDDLNRMHRKLSERGIKYELSNNEEGYPTFYIPVNQSITEADDPDRDQRGSMFSPEDEDRPEPEVEDSRYGKINGIFKSYPYHTSFWLNEPYSLMDAAGGKNPIGHGTHYRMTMRGRFDNHSNEQKLNFKHLTELSSHLHRHGIEHEKSINEWGTPTLYIPANQKKLN